jgi:ADP-ribosylglycohydrolase
MRNLLSSGNGPAGACSGENDIVGQFAVSLFVSCQMAEDESMKSKESIMWSALENKIYGCLLGGLVGDAMGAPVEGQTWQQIEERYGTDGVTDFAGVGTDDTAIREQLIHAILTHNGYISCDEFAATFHGFRAANYGKWWVPVRNMFHKLDSGVALPVDAGYGNTPSSSSAMAISPMGILNAGNPRQAALETFDVAGVIHSGPSGFCRDAACALAAPVAAAFRREASVLAMVEAATAYLHPVSGREMIDCIHKARDAMRQTQTYATFRDWCYSHWLRAEMCDSRETVPVALALFELAEGEPERAVGYSVNFGRDADTIGTMVGGLCGALHGASGLPAAWVQKVEANPAVHYRELTSQLAEVIRRRAQAAAQYADLVADLSAQSDRRLCRRE